MNRILILFLITNCLFLSTSVTFAQHKPYEHRQERKLHDRHHRVIKPELRAKRLTEQLNNKVGLSELQFKAIYDINYNTALSMAALAKNNRQTVGEYKNRKKEIHKNYKVEIAKVLTPEQKNTLKQLRIEQQEQNK